MNVLRERNQKIEIYIEIKNLILDRKEEQNFAQRIGKQYVQISRLLWLLFAKSNPPKQLPRWFLKVQQCL